MQLINWDVARRRLAIGLAIVATAYAVCWLLDANAKTRIEAGTWPASHSVRVAI